MKFGQHLAGSNRWKLVGLAESHIAASRLAMLAKVPVMADEPGVGKTDIEDFVAEGAPSLPSPLPVEQGIGREPQPNPHLVEGVREFS